MFRNYHFIFTVFEQMLMPVIILLLRSVQVFYFFFIFYFFTEATLILKNIKMYVKLCVNNHQTTKISTAHKGRL